MFACTEPRSANQNLSLQFTLGPVPLTPLFAIHRSSTQVTENPNTLSPFLATHTDLSPVSPLFATHTKTAGVYTNNSHSGTSSSSSPKSAGPYFSCTYKLPPFRYKKTTSSFSCAYELLFSQLLSFDIHASDGGVGGTSHESPVPSLPDQLPVPRTCILRTIGAYFSLQQTAYGPLFLLFTCLGGCDG